MFFGEHPWVYGGKGANFGRHRAKVTEGTAACRNEMKMTLLMEQRRRH
jgi:hypothetical protein